MPVNIERMLEDVDLAAHSEPDVDASAFDELLGGKLTPEESRKANQDAIDKWYAARHNSCITPAVGAMADYRPQMRAPWPELDFHSDNCNVRD